MRKIIIYPQEIRTEILILFDTGSTYTEIGKQYNIDRTKVRQIIQNEMIKASPKIGGGKHSSDANFQKNRKAIAKTNNIYHQFNEGDMVSVLKRGKHAETIDGTIEQKSNKIIFVRCSNGRIEPIAWVEILTGERVLRKAV